MIRPNIGILENYKGKAIPFNDKGRMEPLQLGVLAGITPDDIDVKLFDDRLEEIDYTESADLIAISVEIFTAKRAYEIADEYRKLKVPVILGGVHVSAVPDESVLHADCIVVGDAEKIWSTVLEDFKKGELKQRYDSDPGIAHPGFFPRRSIYKDKTYLPMMLLQFGRGCPFTCSYCSTGNYFGGKYYCREVDDVINEIKHQKRKFLFFIDDNIVGNKEKAKELFKELILLKIRWIGQASLDMTDDMELMNLMQRSGCVGLVIGFESISQEGLKSYNKVQNNYLDYERQIKIIRKHGIHIWAAFLLGHDNETTETLRETLDFTIKNKFSFAAFNILMPYPGTEIYTKLESENRLLYNGKWWLSDEYRFNFAAFKPKNMSHQELTDYCFYMRKKFNSFPVIMKRVFSRHSLLNYKNLVMLWGFVWLFRVETLKKQGMHLGYKK